jgi:exoribonuclease R
MPHRPIRLIPDNIFEEGFAKIRSEASVPERFPSEVEAEARAAAERDIADLDRLEIPFVTIDPPGSRDLDQAMQIEPAGDGHRVWYAIADVAAWVPPGGAVDAEAHERGVTIYAPGGKAPLHPPVLSEGAASLLPGQWCPAVVWRLDLDGQGELTATHVERAAVRSVAQHTYEDVPAALEPLLRTVGERRLAIERARGGVRLPVPEQEVVRDNGSWTVRYRTPLASEEWNAQISLLTGIAAARLMLELGVGILRTQPRPPEKEFRRLRRTAEALGVDWPEETAYGEFVATLDPSLPAHAALMHEAAGLGRGARYTAFDGDEPAEREHFALAAAYAHATAPLRRLQDRYVSECCIAACAGTPVPDWVHAGLGRLPELMADAARRAGAVERGVVDLAEALLLANHVGEHFEAVVIDDDTVQLHDPAVRGRIEEGCPEVGTRAVVKVESADPAARKVTFALASRPRP